MRRISCVILSGLVLFSGCGPNPENSATQAPGQPKPLPHFEFRGLVAGKTTPQEGEKAGVLTMCETYKDYRTANSRTTNCDLKKMSLGDASLGKTTLVFPDGKWEWMSLRFPTDSYDLALKAAREAYGEPCAVDQKPLQNAFGAEFMGDESTWCFDTGNLKVRRHAEQDYHWGEFDYFENHARPESKPVNSKTI